MTSFKPLKLTTLAVFATMLAYTNQPFSNNLISSAAAETAAVDANQTSLDAALDAQSDEAKARFDSRNPKQTLEFFGIEPGMTVVDVLPGGGWYTKILLPYLGDEGTVIGADYPVALYENFGFMTPERLEEKKTWVSDWVGDATEWKTDNSASLAAFQLGDMPESMNGTADAIIMVRALHHLNRFEEGNGFLTSALAESFAVLKPGGTLGLVQHHAAEDRPDEWADGSNGYLKKSLVMDAMTAAGFEFVAESSVNSNPKDEAGEGDNVWRLPPALSGAKDDPAKKAAAEAIGESNRMTLKFRKPI